MPTCLATWTHTPPRRYTNNIFHQAELVVPMLSAALEAAPKAIYWQFTLLPWSRGMLEMMKGVKVIARNVTPPAHCKLFGRSSGPGNFFGMYKSAARPVQRLREAVWSACGVEEHRSVTVPPVRIVYMPRTGSGLQSGVWRNFAENASALLRALREALPTSTLRCMLIASLII